MEFRLAENKDLPRLQEIYRELVHDLDSQGIQIWDEAYPMEFFRIDMEKQRLWLLEQDGEPLGALALCKTDPGKKFIHWPRPEAPALYLARLGVALAHRGKGLGRELMTLAADVARNQGAEFLRLFVADCNTPAIKLYESLGYEKREGLYKLRIDETMVLYEYGFELAL